MRWVVVGALLSSLLTGCGALRACTAVGCVSAVTVAATPVATVYEGATATLCVQSRCTSQTLAPDSPFVTVQLGPDNAGPDEEFPVDQALAVHLTVTRAGATLLDVTEQATLVEDQPNGERCDPTCWVAAFDLAAQLQSHGLLAVADPEQRQTSLEHLVRRAGAALLRGRGRPAGEDHALRPHGREGFGGLVEGMDLAIDAGFAQSPRDQLRHLRPKIDDQDGVVMGRVMMRRLRARGSRPGHLRLAVSPKRPDTGGGGKIQPCASAHPRCRVPRALSSRTPERSTQSPRILRPDATLPPSLSRIQTW